MDKFITLAELPIGEAAVIHNISAGSTYGKRFKELGFSQGVLVKAVHKSPFSSALAYEILDTVIALRIEDAEKIIVSVDKSLKIKNNVFAFVGNPNVGKSTLFNNLTGLRQHTGNWHGKTVAMAKGSYNCGGDTIDLVDLPGTYSLTPASKDEEAVLDYLHSFEASAVIIVADATCLERSLYLVLQVMELCKNVVLCVNLIDEAEKRKIIIDLEKLSSILNISVVATDARGKNGLSALIEKACEVINKDNFSNKFLYSDDIEAKITEKQEKLNLTRFDAVNQIISENPGNEKLSEKITYALLCHAGKIASEVVKKEENAFINDRKIDKIVTSKAFGIPIMLLLLGVIFFITITGANYPTALLFNFFNSLKIHFYEYLTFLNIPPALINALVFGIYQTLTWVVSVMLPPMAIFFPLFTLLEDLGLLPRIAFNLDKFFKKSCAHAKQSLCMCMGFGCNCTGIMGTRIIESKRERLIAIITNNLVPCNGRLPTIILLSSIFFTGNLAGMQKNLLTSFFVTLVILGGISISLFASKLLSKTLLKGTPEPFSLELPSYRKPQILKVIMRSVIDKTLVVLGRAVTFAIPAGLFIWLIANIHIGSASLLTLCANFLDPFAYLMGLDGHILLAFILALPANEILLPIILMGYLNTGHMVELSGEIYLKEIFFNNGFTGLNALCIILFSLMHWPCATACLTIKKETNSLWWTFISFIFPTALGVTACVITAFMYRLFFI